MGEMQVFTCQTGPLSLALREGEGERAVSPQGFQGRCLPGGGQGFREASRREGGLQEELLEGGDWF